MKISEVVAFLEDIEVNHGDIEVQSLTGFWIRRIYSPSGDTLQVVPSVGQGRSVQDLLREST